MKRYIIKALKWALNKFEPAQEKIKSEAAWPFPTPNPKPTLKEKLTARPVVKKATTVAKKTIKKAK
jgi:hypothetical protein